MYRGVEAACCELGDLYRIKHINAVIRVIMIAPPIPPTRPKNNP